MCFSVKVNIRSENTALQNTLRSLSQGSYYAGRTEEVLGKAEDALDEFVGAAMNISNDTPHHNVSRQGDGLAMKIRKSERYLGRFEANQGAFNGALSEGAEHLRAAVEQSQNKEMRALLHDLNKLREDKALESRVETVMSGFQEEGKPRLDVVRSDAEGKDVSEHGRPIWNLFENSMTTLETSAAVAGGEQAEVDRLISRLERF